MQYDLATHRNIQMHDGMPSMSLLYAYSKYKKERESAQQAERVKRQNKQRRR